MVASSPSLQLSMRQSSFYWPMQLLSSKRRQALKAVYFFCKTVDDLADGEGDTASKQQQLNDWRQAIKNPSTLPAHLQSAMHDYALPASLFEDILNGMQMDIEHVPAPNHTTLERYCYCVAGAVGLLLIRILGCHDNDSDVFAKQVGQCLQRINILRDIQEDAERGRIYLPREWLGDIAIDHIRRHPSAAHLACYKMVADIQTRFTDANRFIAPADRWRLLPAFCMASVYLRWLEVMVRDDFSYQPHYHLSTWQKLTAMLRGLRWMFRGRINAESIGAPTQ